LVKKEIYMTQGKSKRISINKANNAFAISVCKLNCQKTDNQINKCISEEKGCLMYQVFNKMLYK